jgi:hypothetical protein
MNGFIDTYTHDSELQVFTMQSLITTIHKSPQHPLSLFQPTVSSPVVPWQRLLTAEIVQLLWSIPFALASTTPQLKCQINYGNISYQSPLQNSTELMAPTVLVIISRHRSYRKYHSSIVARIFIAAGTYLPSCYLMVAVYSPNLAVVA